MQTAEIHQFPVKEQPAPKGPQLEDGYTRIANELFEAVTNAQTCPVTLRQMRVVLAVIRKTYGFNKKVDRISDGQIAADTGLSRQNVNKAKRELIAMNVLYLDGHKLGVNKHSVEWDFAAQPEKDNLRQTRDSVSKVETKSVSKSGSHKRQKDTLSTDVDREAPKKQRLNVSEFQDQVDTKALHAFVEHRRALRSPLTQHALGLTVKAAIKASEELGITAEQAIDEAITAGWKTVRADWLRNRGVNSPSADSSIPECPHAEILAAWDEHLGSRKGRAPAAVDWKGTRMAEKLSALWVKYWNATNPSGTVRYSSLEEGVSWWSRVFQHLAASSNFLQSDVVLNNVFNPDTFALAINGNLRQNGGAAR